jgi:hypothetical protein
MREELPFLKQKEQIKFTIPFVIFDGYHKRSDPMRINILCGEDSWVNRKTQEPRLRFGTDNPLDLGWLFI